MHKDKKMYDKLETSYQMKTIFAPIITRPSNFTLISKGIYFHNVNGPGSCTKKVVQEFRAYAMKITRGPWATSLTCETSSNQ